MRKKMSSGYLTKNHAKFYLKVHILMDISPKVSISSIVARIKKFSTYYILKRHKKLRWLKKFWSRGYFVCSIGDANPETIRKYIETQG